MFSAPISLIIVAIESNDPTAAAEIATRQRPERIIQNLDYERMIRNAGPYHNFVRAWVSASTPLDKPLIAKRFHELSVTDLACLNVQTETIELTELAIGEVRKHLDDLVDEAQIWL